MCDDPEVAVDVIYETHSITEDNERGIATGWLEGRLSERGRALAAELGRRRRNDGVDAVFSSDLGRAVETVEIAFAGTDIPLRQDARLRECSYGELNGAPVDVIDAQRLARIDDPFPGGESLRGAVDRLGDFLDELARTHDHQRVVVVAHSAQRWGFEHIMKGTPLDQLINAPFEWQAGWEYTYG